MRRRWTEPGPIANGAALLAALLLAAPPAAGTETLAPPASGCSTSRPWTSESVTVTLPPAPATHRIVALEQSGIDLALELLGPEDDVLARANLDYRYRGPELLALPAAEAAPRLRITAPGPNRVGTFRVCVRPQDPTTERGQAAWRAWTLLATAQAAPAPGASVDWAARAAAAAEAATAFAALGDEPATAWARYVQASHVYVYLLDWDRAATLAAAVARRFTKLGEEHLAAAALELQAASLLEKSAHDDAATTGRKRRRAIGLFDEVIAHHTESGHGVELAWTLNDQAIAFQYLGDRPRAEERYLQAVTVARAAGALAMMNLALANHANMTVRSDPLLTLELLQEIDLSAYPRRSLPNYHYHLGQARAAVGDWPGALSNLDRALELAQQPGDLARARNALALLYSYLGQPERARAYLEENLASPVPGEVAAHAQTLRIAARLAIERREPKRAVAYLEDALPQTGNREEALATRLAIARARPAPAPEDLDGLWADAAGASLRPVRAGIAALALGPDSTAPGPAGRWRERAAGLLADELPLADETDLRLALADRDREAGRISRARSLLEPLLERHMDASRSLGLDAVALRLSRTRERYFRLVLELDLELALAADGDARDAHLERALQRYLQIANLRRSIPPGSAGIRELVAAGERALANAGALADTLEDIRRQTEARFARQARAGRPLNATIVLPNQLTAYLVGDRYAWRVRLDDVESEVTRLGPVAAVAAEIDAVVGAARSPAGTHDRHRTAALADRLGVDALLGSEAVGLVLDGVFGRLPFQLLSPELATVSLVPAIGHERRPPAGPRRPLIVGDPAFAAGRAGPAGFEFLPLLASAREVALLGATYAPDDPVILTGAGASVERVLAALPGAGVAHLATHAWANPAVPQLSGMLFAASGSVPAEREFLSQIEIMTLDIGADLVVLSACETGRGDGGSIGGAETIGAAFLAAGAGAVLVNQWQAADAATVALMDRFHAAVRAGADPAAALQAAQAHVRGMRRLWRDPFYWAGWTLLRPLELESAAAPRP